MPKGGERPEECASFDVHPEVHGSICGPPVSHSPSNASDCTAPPGSSATDSYAPCSPLVTGKALGSIESQPPLARVASERAVQQAVIIVEEEPALVHTRLVQHPSSDLRDHQSTVYAWSPLTPELAELIPIGTTPSQRESVITHETDASPSSPYGSPNGSPQPVTFLSATRASAAPCASAHNAAIARDALSLQSSTCMNSSGTESVQGTPSPAALALRASHTCEAECATAKELFTTGDGDPAMPPSQTAAEHEPPSDFHRCATAAPTRLRVPSSRPARSPSPSLVQEHGDQTVSARRPSTPSRPPSTGLHSLVSHRDADSPALSSAPLSLHAPRVSKTNASGGTVPNVPAIRLPVAHAPSGLESDRSINVMGYGPRSAPNACSLVSARSGRSSRSARHSHRCVASLRAALPSLKELFPTLPAEMYLARERLCVAQDNTGRLGMGAYGTVQRAELYPPEVEVPRFFTPVAEMSTNASVPNTPRYSPANALLASHNFASIASAVSGADGGLETTLFTGAPGREHSHVHLHSRLESMASTDSMCALPIHQQPYSNQTASFYNGLDDVPGLAGVESLNNTHWPVRGQSPEAESVVLCGSLAVSTESGGGSAPAPIMTKGQPGVQSAHQSLSAVQEQREPQPHLSTTPPLSETLCSLSQRFPDLPVVLMTKTKAGGASGFSLTSPLISVPRLVGQVPELAAEDDNTVRMSADEDEAVKMFSHLLRGPMTNEEEEMDGEEEERSLASTAGTRRFKSPGSQRGDNRTCFLSSRTTVSHLHECREEDDEAFSERRSGRSATLPTQTLIEVADVAGVVGGEGKPFCEAASGSTAKQQQTLEVCLKHKDNGNGSSPLMRAGPFLDAVRRTTNVYKDAGLCLPLVLSGGRMTTTSSASHRTWESSLTGSGQHNTDALLAEKVEELKAAHQSVVAAPTPRLDTRDNGDAFPGINERRVSSFFLADGQEISFLASATFPELQESRSRVGDDTLTSTAQGAVAQAVREALEEFDSANSQQHGDSRQVNVDDVEAEGVRAGDELPRCDVVGEKSAPSRMTKSATQPIPLPSSNTPTLTSAAMRGCAVSGGFAATNATAINGDRKRIEQVSPTSTVSSFFSSGATNVTTARTTNQDSTHAASQVKAVPLQTTGNASESPLMRYGVNPAMILEAVSNGCAPFRPVAVKVVEKSDLADNAMKLNAFHNELRMASRLNHPCLVNMFGVTEDAENFYLVMDMAEKGNLTQYQKEFGVSDTRIMAPRFLADVVLALEYLRDGSQHTYWMTANEAAKPANATGEDHADKDDAGVLLSCEALSCAESASTVSLRPTADVSPTTTPKPSALSVSGTLQQQRAEEGADKGAWAEASVAVKEKGEEGERAPTCSDTTLSQGDTALMRESIVLHRDVKLDNLLLTWDFHVKLADFGDACFYGDEEANTFGGTPSYISPEVIQSSKASPCSDLWALGCILYELLVGEKLFTGSLREVAHRIQTFSAEDLVFPASPTKPLNDMDCEDDEDADVDGHGDADDAPPRQATITEAAKDLVRQLLRHVPEERLGSAERGGFAALKRHPFFAEISWATVLETTNMTTTNTDYTSELCDYLESGESVVYCSPVKVLPSGEAHARTRPAQLAAQGSLVMVLTDAPRLFLVNPDTDTIQFWLPWSSELRVGVLRADCFTITVPISDVLLSPSTPSTAFNGGASLSMASRTNTGAASTITYTFYDTTRRADLWGVKIHHLQSVCPTWRDRGGSTPTFASRQSSTTQPTSSTRGVPSLHWPAQTRRATPTLSPRAGGCLLHRLRTTPRSARAGSISSHALSFNDAAVATPHEGHSTVTTHTGSLTDVSGCGTSSVAVASTGNTGPSTTLKTKPMTRYSQPIRLPATSFLATSVPASTPDLVVNGKASTPLTSPAGVSSGRSSTELRSPEIASASHVVAAPTHRRTNTMTVTIASSSSPQPSRKAHPCSLSHTAADSRLGVSPVDAGATMADAWMRTAVSPAETSPTSAVCTSDAGMSLCEGGVGSSASVGVATPRAFAQDTSSQSEATPGPSSAQRHTEREPEMGCSFTSQGSGRCDGEAEGGRAWYTPLRTSSFSCAGGTATVTVLPKETISKARQQYKKTQRRKTQP